MTCPLCGARKARRACPALGREICPVCCGTKRLVEIRCPDSCGWLRSAQAHPAAAVQRQRERDVSAALAILDGLGRDEYNLLRLLVEAMRKHRSTAIPALVDDDVAEAAHALASTEETAARGIIYEHHPQSLPAQRLVQQWQAVLTEVAAQAPTRFHQQAATVLRRLERAARSARAAAEGDTAWLDSVERTFGNRRRDSNAMQDPGAPTDAPQESGRRIVLP